MKERLPGFLTILHFLFSFSLVTYAGGEPNRSRPTMKEDGRIFIINSPVKDLDEFRQLVKQAMALKPYGKVKINVSTLADKSFHEIPAKGSSWHEYASSNPTPFKFFPDPKLAPFIPAEFVKKNRELLLAKVKILREHGMEGAFIGYEPNFMPAAFFDAYPSILGPRIDHPRRSTEKAFAPCLSVREAQVLYANMTAEMLKQAPEITTLSFKTNDAGAGICWSDWLYTGPNGPSHCKNLGISSQVNAVFNAYKEGAAKAGRELSIYMDPGSSNFSETERIQIQAHLPENCYFLGDSSREIDNIGGTLASLYPVTGIINLVPLLNQLRSLSRNQNKTIFIGFRAAYDRGAERNDMTGLILGLVARKLKSPATEQGAVPALQELQQLSEEWAGKKSGNILFNAFNALNEAMTYKASTFPRVHSLYWGVTERMITRPLVVAPQRLTDKEEAYFLPYVFNVSVEEARMDYMDVHGGRNSIQPGVVNNYVRLIQRAANLFEQLDNDAPKKDFFRRMAIALRINASIMRSCGNFADAQVIRDRNSAVLTGPTRRPDKEPTFTGHPDFIAFNNVMRDELDNTQELIGLLEKGGLALVIHAGTSAYEDRFLLGPDLINQLKQKRKIMLDHWQDIEDYLASPFK